MPGTITIPNQAPASVAVPSPGFITIFSENTGLGLVRFKFSDGSLAEYLTTLMPAFYDVVQDFGAVGDMRTVFDGSCNVGTPTKIGSATAAFVATDVGKRITLAFAGAAGAMYVGTITAVDSAIQVTVSPGVSTTVASKGLSLGTDDTAAWQNALNAAANAASPGAVIIAPTTSTNRFMITSTLTVAKGGWTIQGIGRAHTSDIGDYTKSGGSWLCWNGAASAALLSIQPVAGATNAALQAPLLRSMGFDCRNGDQNQALKGIELYSAHGFHFTDFFIMDALAVGLDVGVIQGALGEAKDCTRGTFENGCIRELDKDPAVTLGSTTTTGAGTFTVAPFALAITSGLNFTTAGFVWVNCAAGYPVLVQYTGGGGTGTLTGCTVDAQEVINAPTWVAGANVVQCSPSNAACIRLDGVTTANACCSVMNMLQLSHGTTWGPAAVEFRNADSWLMLHVIINGGNATNDGAINRIRKPGVRLNGSNSVASLAARNNTMRDGSAGAGGVSAMGVLNTGARLLSMSGPNYWDLYELANGEAIPTAEGNCYFDWNANGGWRYGQRGATSIVDQAIAAATLTLLTGSLVVAPPQGFQVGTVLRWTITGTGGALGVAANTITVRIGTAGTTADAAVATFTTTVGTAAASEFKIVIELTIRTLGAAATAMAECTINNSAAAGFINATVNVLAGTMAAFSTLVAQQFVHVDLLTGAAKTATIKQVITECINPANP